MINNFLRIDDNNVNVKIFVILTLVALVFSMAVRLIWVDQVSGIESFKWNNEVMINTNDGYLYAEGARDNLAGFHQENDLSSMQTPLSKLTSLLASILPISFETLILYMPAFFGSLLVLPLMLIGRVLKQDLLGFTAALLASIAWSYYNRTMTGYYDTDMLVVVLPSMVVYSLIAAATLQRSRYLVLVAISLILTHLWYEAGHSLNMAMLAMVFAYTVIFERKNIYFYKILLFMGIAVVGIPLWIKIALIFALITWFKLKPIEDMYIVIGLLFIVGFGIIYTGGVNTIIDYLKIYVYRPEVNSETSIGLNFFSVLQTVREASQIPFETFANRISGHTITFVLSTIGYVLLALRYKVMWLALPMIGLGFLALKGGLRFTVYAVPINALGISFLIVFLSQKIQSYLKYLVMFVLTCLVLYPNIIHVINYKVPTVFNKQEVEVLDSLKQVVKREDYVLAWWDYGYPIRYYSDVKTLIDGAKHGGAENYPVSFALIKDQKNSTLMARMAVEYTESAYQEKRSGSYIQMMMEDNNISNPDDFLVALSEKKVKLPEKTRDVYYYLPIRMLDILPTVTLFSNLDLATGKQLQRPFFYQSSRFKQIQQGVLAIGGGIVIDLNRKTVQLNNQTIPINTFYTTEFGEDGHQNVEAKLGSMTGTVSVIYMKNYNRFLVLDQKMLNSTYIQLLVLENYDKNLFELVVSNPYAKVYKLKI